MDSELLSGEQIEAMTTFEIITTVLSVLAFIISLSAFIISIIKSVNEKKAYKKQFLIDNLNKLSINLNKELTLLEQLDPEILIGKIFKRIENNEKFDFYNEILNVYNSTSILTSNALIMLSSYMLTPCNQNLMEALNEISNDISYCMQITIKNKDNRLNLIKEYVAYKKKSFVKSYTKCKYDILIEFSNTIKHLINDKISNAELNSYFIEFNAKK